MASVNKAIENVKLYKEKIKKLKELYKIEFVKLINEAIQIAIKTAEEATPPNVEGSGGKGTLAKHWKEDSDKEAIVKGNKITFTLRNNLEYAKWVDKGHRMDKHFVPGLFIDESGNLVYDAKMKGKKGIVVGTKTKRVKGFHMVEKAERAFKKYIKQNYKKRMKELWSKI